MRDYRFFVYMLNSSSRRALYTGMTNCVIDRVNEHRSREDKRSFTAQYRAFRLVYYEEFADVHLCIRREKEIKGWTRAKKNALVETINPKWRDLMAEWEEKYGLDFVVPIPPYEGRARQQQNQRQMQPQKQTQGPSPASLRSLAQDDKA
ncbi:MAG TPA: GIY-YIG nuclease family protein [Terriglobales bacterium]|nr:GIY-YIG nuclease family protein [Terriglobales bacterium]